MINVGDKFKIQWERDNDSTSPWTLLLKEDGLWWALNHPKVPPNEYPCLPIPNTALIENLISYSFTKTITEIADDRGLNATVSPRWFVAHHKPLPSFSSSVQEGVNSPSRSHIILNLSPTFIIYFSTLHANFSFIKMPFPCVEPVATYGISFMLTVQLFV